MSWLTTRLPDSRLLDLLLDINQSSAIPTEKRIDISLPPTADSKLPVHPVDEEHDVPKDPPLKKLEDLLADVPHLSYEAAKDKNPDLVKELEKGDNESYPTHFLSADDIDNYLHEIDTRIEPETHVPTLAPVAHPNLHPPLHPLLKNPNSATSWLRRNAPHIFLQGPHDGDAHDDTAGGTGAGGAGAGTDKETASTSRKSRGGKGERSGKAARPSKRTSAIKAAAAADKGGDWDVSMDDDPDFASTPAPKGKRKRAAADDDAGYRPKGSGSRPTKKKRKSEGGTDGTPTVSRKSKRESTTAED